MGGFQVQIEGLDGLAQQLGVATDVLVKAAGSAVYGQCLALAELANRKGMVPVSSGHLKNSLYITPAQQVGDAMTCELGYAAEYAAEVHESPQPTVSQGGFRRSRDGVHGWLRKAVSIHARAIQVRLAESLRGALSTGQVIDPGTMGIPASATEALAFARSGISKYQRKNGFTPQTMRAMRMAKKGGALQLVRRWKRPKKGR